MLSLRKQLKTILPELLPPSPLDAIKGTELIRLVRFRLDQDYSDATLRYHFSIMSCDPSSPIAKVEQGQGYYLRSATVNSLAAARNVIPLSQGRLGEDLAKSPEAYDLAMSRAAIFRAIYARFCENDNKFPYVFDSGDASEPTLKDLWKYPDATVIDWEVDGLGDERFDFDRKMLEIKRSLGLQPFVMTCSSIKLEVSHNSLRADFFQSLSNSSWGHRGELVIVSPLSDEAVAEDLRQLGARFGIGVVSFGVDLQSLDEYGAPRSIRRMSAREFEALQGRFAINRICSAVKRDSLDWSQLMEIRSDNQAISGMFAWVTRCIQDCKAYTFDEFKALSGARVPGDGTP